MVYWTFVLPFSVSIIPKSRNANNNSSYIKDESGLDKTVSSIVVPSN